VLSLRYLSMGSVRSVQPAAVLRIRCLSTGFLRPPRYLSAGLARPGPARAAAGLRASSGIGIRLAAIRLFALTPDPAATFASVRLPLGETAEQGVHVQTITHDEAQ